MTWIPQSTSSQITWLLHRSTPSLPTKSLHSTEGSWLRSTLYCCSARVTVGAKNQTSCSQVLLTASKKDLGIHKNVFRYFQQMDTSRQRVKYSNLNQQLTTPLDKNRMCEDNGHLPFLGGSDIILPLFVVLLWTSFSGRSLKTCSSIPQTPEFCQNQYPSRNGF